VISGSLFDDENEMKLHNDAVYFISIHYLDIPEEKVARLYEIVLRRYKSQAKIRGFLAVLVAKRVEYLLRKWRGSIFGKVV
jgi:Protein of unknown function (DUF3562)